MRFIELPIFTTSLRQHLDDESYRAMQVALSLRPEQGVLIQGGAGLRKMRWGVEGRGKRGGVRTIYYWAVNDDLCYMVYMYAKNEEGDLSPTQIRTLARLVRKEFR